MINQKVINNLKAYLDGDEEVQAMLSGSYLATTLAGNTWRSGSLCATNKRVIFYSKRVFGYDFEVIPYSNISSIEMGKRITGNFISLFAVGNKAEMKWIKDKDIADFVQYVKDRLGTVATKNTETTNPDPLEQLKKLGQLKDSGVITDIEFEEKKKEILSRM